MDRIILHCDMNGFYASVELIDKPHLKNKPMAVCGNPENRHGIILAKNEIAKKYGIMTAEANPCSYLRRASITLDGALTVFRNCLNQFFRPHNPQPIALTEGKSAKPRLGSNRHCCSYKAISEVFTEGDVIVLS